MASITVSSILLTQKAEIKTVKIPNPLTLDSVQKILKKKVAPEILGTYKSKNLILSLLGYTTGKAGTENKHELPPPLDSALFFGDILLVASTSPNNYIKPVTFKPEEYEAFYTKAFGGFDDIGSDDSSSDEEEEEEVVEEEVLKEVEKEEEEEDDEEEEEEEEEAVEEFEAVAEAEEPAPRKAAKAVKKKRIIPSLLISQTGASQILHVPKSEHLQSETVSGANAVPMRMKNLERIVKTFDLHKIVDIDSTELEHCIYNASVKDATRRNVTCHWGNTLFEHIYETKVRQIVGNLLPSAYIENKKLLEELRSKKYTIEQICFLDTYTMCNDRWRDYIHRRAQREKRLLEGNKAMATDQFFCKNCHKRECTYYEMQTRSADEPMTIFITCINCGKHWRQ